MNRRRRGLYPGWSMIAVGLIIIVVGLTTTPPVAVVSILGAAIVAIGGLRVWQERQPSSGQSTPPRVGAGDGSLNNPNPVRRQPDIPAAIIIALVGLALLLFEYNTASTSGLKATALLQIGGFVALMVVLLIVALRRRR